MRITDLKGFPNKMKNICSAHREQNENCLVCQVAGNHNALHDELSRMPFVADVDHLANIIAWSYGKQGIFSVKCERTKESIYAEAKAIAADLSFLRLERIEDET